MRDDGTAAPSFFCPLTMAMMKDPVQDREGLFRVIVIHRRPPLAPKELDAFAQSTGPFYLPFLIAGHSYEKEAILQWLAKNETSPITRNRLSRKHLVPNRALKEAIKFEGDFDLLRVDVRDEMRFMNMIDIYRSFNSSQLS